MTEVDVMGARDVEYVELYTRDEKQALDYFAGFLAFTVVAESTQPEMRSVLLRQGTVQMVVSTGPATHKFLDAHGDGIADIALSCDDVAATRDAAVAAGARVLHDAAETTVISGFGDVRHTLLPATAASSRRLPAGRAWTVSGAQARTGGRRIQLLDHIAICLEGGALAEYVERYTSGYGLSHFSSEYIAVGGQAMDSTVLRSPSGGVTFTLIEPDRKQRPGQIDAFLDANGGSGVQHLAFLVDEIIPAVREFRTTGVRFLSTPGTYYDMLADRYPEMREEIPDLRDTHVLIDRDEWGVLLQLFTRSPYERGTLFYELIQRRGSRGFGTANIRALYEAVERDRQAAARG
jgi:4-hydroxymandelate synthase